MYEVLPRLIVRERIVAPLEHQGVLVEPSADAIDAMWRGARPDAPIADTMLSTLRASLRARIGIDGPIVAAGHQAELFHAGVFAKNLAAAVLAQRWNARAVFLSVDSDLPKADHLRVTRCNGGQLSIVRVVLPGIRPDLPVEAQAISDADEWTTLFAQLHESSSADSALDCYASGFLGALRAGKGIALAHAGGQSAVERELGIEPLRVVRMSELAATPEFAAFARHWLDHARQFADAYNAALSEYRAQHKLRSDQHPAASLMIGANEVATPFWRMLDSGRRETVTVWQNGKALETRDVGSLRPKALLLSAFGRLMLADLFIHGIGGAKYDEVTERFIRTCFGCEPGAMVCISATLHRSRCAPSPTLSELFIAQHRVRDFAFNPHLYLEAVPSDLLDKRRDVLARMQECRSRPRCSRDEWRRRVVPVLGALHSDLREVNQRIAALAPGRRTELHAAYEQLRAQAARAKIAADREAFFALHATCELQTLVGRIRERLAGG